MSLVTLASDNFTRANENPLSDGGKWGSYSFLSAMPEVSSDLCQPSTLSTDNGAVWLPAFPADQWASLKVGTYLSTGTRAAILFLRSSSSVLTLYEGGAPNTPYEIRKFVSGTGTTLATSAVGARNGDVVYFSVQGTTLTLEVNGVVVCSATDSSITSGQPGFDLYSSTALGDTTITLFQAGKFSSGSGAGLLLGVG